MLQRVSRTINRHATAYVAGECARAGVALSRDARVGRVRVGEESNTGEAVAGIYGGLLIFAALIIGAATLAPSGK